MKYFNTLPTIIQQDFNGNYITVTNLIARSYLLPSLKNNLFLFYQYTLKDIDNIENIAYKYYNDIDRFWMIAYSNDILHPIKDWPMNSQLFSDYIIEKYKTDAANDLSIPTANVSVMNVLHYVANTTHHYEKIITTYSSTEPDKQIITIQIDEDTFNSTVDNIQHYTLNGVTITKEITTRDVKIYTYEDELNESKRNIYLLKDTYTSDMEKQLSTLMG